MHIHKEDQAALDRFSEANNGAIYDIETNKDGRVTQLVADNQGISDLAPLSPLSSLTLLGLSNNQIADLAPLSPLSSLTHLRLSNNQIADLAPLSPLSSLTLLRLSNNQIADLAPLSPLSSLTLLYLHNNQIADLARLSPLSSLTFLRLGNNQIADLAPLSPLSSLTLLGLDNNQIANLAPLSTLSSLTHLYLHNNQIADLAPLSPLSSLTLLGLSNNQIADLNPISNLLSLKELHLDQNPFSDLRPLSKLIGKMERLHFLQEFAGEDIYLENVKTQIPPTDIVHQGKKAVLTWFDAMNEDEIKPLNQVKVMLIGDGAAGKTSLVQRIKHNTFDPKQNQTNGIRIEPWTLENSGDPIEVKFWDFGGQEIMHATHQFFMTQRCLYMVVQNAREKDNTVQWLEHVKSFAGSAPVLVVVNKMDVNPGFSLDRAQLKADYPNIVGFHHISCETGEGVTDVVATLADKLPEIDLVRGYWLKRWFAVKNALEQINVPYIKKSSYEQTCTDHEVVDRKHQDVLLRYLNDLGVMLWFEHHHLKDFQVLNPEWATNGVYKIITSYHLARTKGVLQLSDLDKILPKSDTVMENYPTECHGFFISLMEKFELCFRYDGEKDTVLVPSLLDKSSPEDRGLEGEVLHFVMSYSFLPPSLIPRLIVRLHRDLEKPWRTGMILNHPNGDARAVIVVRAEERTIEIQVSGPHRRDYFVTLRYFLSAINGEFKNVIIKETIIPPGKRRNQGVNYDNLIKAEEENIPKLPESGEIFDVAELLGEYRIPVQSSRELVVKAAEQVQEVTDRRPDEEYSRVVSTLIKDSFEGIAKDLIKNTVAEVLAAHKDVEKEQEDELAKVVEGIVKVGIPGVTVDIGKVGLAIRHALKERKEKRGA